MPTSVAPTLRVARLPRWGLLALAAVALLAVPASALGTGTQVTTDPVGDATSPLPATQPAMLDLAADIVRVGMTDDASNVYVWLKVNTPNTPTWAPGNCASNTQNVGALYYHAQMELNNVLYAAIVCYDGAATSGVGLYVNDPSGSAGLRSQTAVVSGMWVCNELRITFRYQDMPGTASGNVASGVRGATSDAQTNLYTESDNTAPGPHTLGTPAPSEVPTGLTATYTATPSPHILLNWVAPVGGNDPSGYRVERSTVGPGGPWTVLATIPASPTSYQDFGITSGTTYWYRVQVLRCQNTMPGAYTNVATDTVPPLPVPPACAISAATPLPRHPGQTVTFAASSGTSPYTWATAPAGSPASGSGASFSSSWSATGAKTVTVTDANLLQGTCTFDITPWPPLSCAPNPATVQVNVGITFTATGGDGTYSWSAPGGSPASGSGSTFLTQWGSAGPQVATVSSAAQTVSCNVNVTLYPPLLCTPATQTVTSGGSTLDATGGDGTYSWSMPGGNPPTFTGPTYTSTFTNSGTYTATVSSGGQTTTCSVTVAIPCGDVNAAFEPTADSPMVGQTVTFIDRSLGDVYARQWDFGDGSTSLDVNPAHEFYSPGEYHVRLTVIESGSGCTDSQELLVRVVTAHPVPQEQPAGAGGGGAPAPIANAGPDQAVLEGATVHLAGQATGIGGDDVTYTWRLAAAPAGVDVPLSGSGPRFSFVAPQVFNPDQPLEIVYELVVSRGGAISQGDAVTVTVRASDQRPAADAGREQEVERGMTAQLDGSRSRDPEGKPLQFTWTVLTGGVTLQGADSATPSFVVPRDGTAPYADLQLTVSDGRWQHASSVRVWFKPAPVAPAGIAVEAVDGDTFRFSPGIDGRSYQWDFADGTTSTAATPEHTFLPGTHEVELVVTLADGRQQVFTKSVTVAGSPPSPDALAGPEPEAGEVSVLAWVLGIAGLVALAVGAAIFLVMRKRAPQA